MLSKQPWMLATDGLEFELEQARDEGKLLTQAIIDEVNAVLAADKALKETQARAAAVLDAIQALPYDPKYPYQEPSDLEGIRALRPQPVKLPEAAVNEDAILGAWLARCAGCLLGQPIEGWRRDRIVGLLRDTGNYPVTRYISSDIGEELRQKYDVKDKGHVYGSRKINWINNVNYMPEDDDTNYTVIGLKLMETYGPDFTPEDAGECWLTNLPLLHVCTAERVAYRNLVNSILPPLSASTRNPYREWIGAQIRADFFGYVTPGNPEKGAELAWRDAAISHVKNGIYGEMWVAAMLSAAAVTDDMDTVLRAGLSQIPASCRLASAIHQAMGWKGEGVSWEQALEKIHGVYVENNGHHWCHTISNALIVLVALMYGDMDLGKTVGISICPGFDTDCNAATAGSILGMMLGAKRLPASWIDPLCDTVISGVDGFGKVRISELAARTADMARKLL